MMRRLLIGLLLVAVPAAFLIYAMHGFRIRTAVLTAELTNLRAPIAGEVVEIGVGRGYLAEPATAIVIRNERVDRRDLRHLEVAIAEAAEQLAVRRDRLARLDEEIAAAEKRLAATLAGLKADLLLGYEITEAEIEAVTARVAYLSSQFARTQRLQGTATSVAAMELAQADLLEAQATLRSLQVALEQNQQRQDLLDRQVLVADLIDDAMLVADSLRRMTLDRQETAEAIALLEIAVSNDTRRLEHERAALQALYEAELTVPGDAVVWDVLIGRNTFVSSGQTLASFFRCGSLLVEVAVDDATLELLSAGQGATIRLYGSSAELRGSIWAIYGSGARMSGSFSLVAQVKEVSSTEAIVLLEVDEPPGVLAGHRLCEVGRTASVEFDGVGFLDPLLNRLW